MNITLGNNATSTLAGDINDSVTSLDVAAGEGVLFPVLTAGKYFYCTLAQGTNIEIVKVTARSTDTFTIVRAQDDSVAAAFTTGAKVEVRLNKGQLLDHTTERILADAAKNLDTYKNYISNPNAVENATGWVRFLDSDAAVPVDGTGGAPDANFKWERNTTAPLNDIADFLLTKDATARRGEGVAWTAAIDVEDRGKLLGISFNTILASGTYTANDLAVFVYDVTNSALLNNGAMIVMTAPAATTGGIVATALPGYHSGSVLIPPTCASVRLLIYETVVNAAAYNIQFSNFKLTDNPFVYKNLVSEDSFFIGTANGYGSTNTKTRKFSGTPARYGINNVTYASDAALGDSFTIVNAGNYQVTYIEKTSSTASVNAHILLNGLEDATKSVGVYYSQIASQIFSISVTRRFAAGDVLRLYSDVAARIDGTTQTSLSITRVSSSENIITPASTKLQTMTLTQNNTSMTNVTAEFEYALGAATITNFFGGVSTAYGSTSQSFYALDDAANTRTKFIFNQAGTAIVHLNTIVGVNSVYPAVYLNGSIVAQGSNTSAGSGYGTVAHSLSVSKDSFISVGITSGAIYTGTANPVVTSITFIPDYANLLAAIPVQQTCYLKDVKAYNVTGGNSSADTVATRTLNVINETGSETTGTCSFASLATNIITLQPGTYRFWFSVPGNWVTRHFAILYNVTSASVVALGNAQYSDRNIPANPNYSEGIAQVTISAPTQYDIRHYTTTAENTDGQGLAHGKAGYSNIYTQVKITKIK